MFNDPGPGSLTVRIIHCRIALEVRNIQHLCLEPDGTIFQCSQRVAEIGIDGAGIDNSLCQFIQFLFLLQIICVQAYLNAL